MPLWAGEGLPPRLSQRDVSAFQICIRELTIGIAHALLGDQQHHSAQYQDGAQYIEDGGAHAAGGGQGRAGFVFDLSGNRKLRDLRAAALYLNFNRLSQRIVAGRSLGFYQVVGAVGKAVKGGCAVFVGLSRQWHHSCP